MSQDAGTAESSEARPKGALQRAAYFLAIAGGVLSLGVALLVTVSISLRAGGFGGVRGDFEFVQMGTALAVFAFLPWCQARRGNVFVDTFTNTWPKPVQAWLDALWDVVFAVMMAVIAWRLGVGARDALASNTSTMVLLMPVWPAIAACAVMAGLLAIVSVMTAAERVGAAR